MPGVVRFIVVVVDVASPPVLFILEKPSSAIEAAMQPARNK